MKKQNWTMIVVMGWLMIVLNPLSILSQYNLRKEGHYYMADITKEYQVTPGGELIMDKVRGDVRVQIWDKNIVAIREIRQMDVYTEAEAKAILKEAELEYKQDGNTILVKGAYVRRSIANSTFDIRLPMVFNIQINTAGGDISVRGLKGNEILNTSGGDIELLGVDGRVEAKTSGGDVTVMENKKEVRVKTSGGDIVIKDVQGAVEARTSGGDIAIINNQAQVTARTSGGSINLLNIGATVDAHTSGGDIEVDGSKGKLNLTTSGGDIEVRDASDVVSASTSGGDIKAAAVLGGISAKTSGGDLILRDITGFIEGHTSGGDIEAQMRLTDFSKDHHVDLQSVGGDITLYLPEKLPATITAILFVERSAWQTYDIYSDFPLTKSKKSEGKDRQRGGEEIRSEGAINGGGDAIRLETTNGDIKIKKL